MRRALGWLACAVLLTACGGGEQAAQGVTPASGSFEGTVTRETRTVLVFVLDGLRDDVDAEVAPRLSALAAESLRFTDFVTSSTGTNSAVASLLTGLEPPEHGLGSLHDRGRARIAGELETFVERFHDAGWGTHAILSSPQLRLSGFEQGFDTFEAPALSERGGRTAQQSYDLARAALTAQLADERPLLLVVHLADLRGDAAPEEAGLYLERFLTPHVKPGSELAAALATAANDPGGALTEARRLLGRARGSDAYVALNRALHAGRLAVLDRGVGAFLELVDDAGRLDQALVAVVSTKGALLAPPKRSGGPAFLPAILRVPLWLRLPGGSARGDMHGATSSIDLAPTLLGVLGEDGGGPGEDLLRWSEQPTSRADRVVRVCDARFERFAAFDAQGHLEQNSVSTGGGVAYARDGMRVLVEDPEKDPLAHLRAALAEAPRFGLRIGSSLPGLEVHWRFADGQVLDVDAQLTSGGVVDTSGSGTRGQAALDAPGSVHVLGSRRDLPVRLTLEAAGLDVHQVAVGAGLPLPMTLLPMLASADAPEWPELEEADVSLVHDGGGWARLSVGGEAPEPVEALVALYPPDPQRRDVLEWSAPFDVEVEHVAGRTDAVRIRGTSPLELQLEGLPKTQLAFAVRVGEFTVEPSAIRVDARKMNAPGVVDLYIPDWLDGVTPLLADSPSEFPPTVLVGRTGSRAPFSGRALTADERQFVRFLGAGE